MVAGIVFGRIVDGNGTPVAGLRVEAWDRDPLSDDLMGVATTDEHGAYSIYYATGRWDFSLLPGGGRPDIYIRVLGENGSTAGVELVRSEVHPDQPTEIDLEIGLRIPGPGLVTSDVGFEIWRHGFRFSNHFALQPSVLGLALGTWHMGFCGGMSGAALHYFLTQTYAPTTTTPPGQGTRLYEELLTRQIRSLTAPKLIIDDIYRWQVSPDDGARGPVQSIGERTRAEWPKLRAMIDEGRPAILLLIRTEGFFANPTVNHQVLAIGYEWNPPTGALSVKVYDPNTPGRVGTLKLSLARAPAGLTATDSSGAKLRGFFVNPNADYTAASLTGRELPIQMIRPFAPQRVPRLDPKPHATP